MKSGKIFKACSLSLALLLLGGATVTPLANVYATEQGQETNQAAKKKIRITYKGDSSFEFIHVWNETKKIGGTSYPLQGSGDNRYIEADLEYDEGDQIGYIVAKIDPNDSTKWIKDMTGKENDAGNRYVTATKTNMEFGVEEHKEGKPEIKEYKPTPPTEGEGSENNGQPGETTPDDKKPGETTPDD
ncbi:hypothetical protein, partial [uncultured Anaerococcus sp.]|uniref:hypothetical protein n=1 Tax=uncultured Anaerococcus sp. TaxID=293428 RepID=UPI0028896357